MIRAKMATTTAPETAIWIPRISGRRGCRDVSAGPSLMTVPMDVPPHRDRARRARGARVAIVSPDHAPRPEGMSSLVSLGRVQLAPRRDRGGFSRLTLPPGRTARGASVTTHAELRLASGSVHLQTGSGGDGEPHDEARQADPDHGAEFARFCQRRRASEAGQDTQEDL